MVTWSVTGPESGAITINDTNQFFTLPADSTVLVQYYVNAQNNSLDTMEFQLWTVDLASGALIEGVTGSIASSTLNNTAVATVAGAGIIGTTAEQGVALVNNTNDVIGEGVFFANIQLIRIN